MRLSGQGTDDYEGFVEAFREADLVVASGAGGIGDLWPRWSMLCLEFLETAMNAGKPAAMFSHGFCRIHRADLVAKAKAVLPALQVIGLRERRLGVPTLKRLGVSPDKVIVTGDDAIAVAYQARAVGTGNGIGINLRIAPHAGLGDTFVDAFRPLVQECGRLCSAPLVPVPIARHFINDARIIRLLLDGYGGKADGGEDLDTPLKVIHQVRSCRIVITGAYHAAVFALAQGIPSVCVAKSPYNLDKFEGLAELFGSGCWIVDLNASNFAQDLRKAALDLWAAAPRLRPVLLDAAAQQTQWSEAAYLKVRECVTSSGHR
jgi:colanic acid/amylovoran biosynthesis protein